jgi:integrase
MKDPFYKRCHCRGDAGRELGPGCPQLRRKDGSWNPRHGTWYFSLELPPGIGGKRRPRMRRGGFATRDDAGEEYEAAKAKIRKRADPSGRLRTGPYLQSWLDGHQDLKQKTRYNYQLILDTYLIPLLGHIELGRLTSDDIEEAFATIREWNASLARGEPVRRHQRHVGPAAMQRIRACLRVALNYAVDTGKLDVNPAERKRVRLKTPPAWKPLAWTPAREEKFWRDYRALEAASASARGDRQYTAWRTMKLRPAPAMVWLPAHAGRFLDHCDQAGERLTDMFELIMLTAMRRGETCGLTWSQVDFDAKEILAGPARVQVGWEVVEYDDPAEGKSEASLRHISMGDREDELLRRVQARQKAERAQWGAAYHDSDYVFTLEDGTPVHPAVVSETAGRRAFEAGLPPVRVHDWRHAWASYALAAAVDVKVVQERLGHSSSKLTLDTYTTVLSELDRTAGETVSDMVPVRGRAGPPGQKDSARTLRRPSEVPPAGASGE